MRREELFQISVILNTLLLTSLVGILIVIAGMQTQFEIFPLLFILFVGLVVIGFLDIFSVLILRTDYR